MYLEVGLFYETDCNQECVVNWLLKKIMGLVKKKIKVSNSKKPERFFEEEFLIDSGALLFLRP